MSVMYVTETLLEYKARSTNNFWTMYPTERGYCHSGLSDRSVNTLGILAVWAVVALHTDFIKEFGDFI